MTEPAKPMSDEQLLALPQKERARLVRLLIESLDRKQDPDADEAWIEELERRAKEAHAHPEESSPWPEVKARILSRLKAG